MTGWNYQTLSQCSECSKAQLKKYTAAMLILMIVWSITGYCFADRYVNLPIWGCAMVSLVFVTIVVMIERQIILTVNPSWLLKAFRTLIAIMMAIIGSMIFDQVIFGKDINKQMAETIELQTADLTKQRVGIAQAKIMHIQAEKDSLNAVNAELQADINKHPWIIQKSTTNTQSKLVVNGEIKTVNSPSVTTNQVANPKQDVVNSNNEKIKILDAQEQEYNKKMMTIEEDTRKECQANVGFLEELEAMWSILATRLAAAIFYGVLFLFLMFLELFVLVSKIGDNKCDYEKTIAGSQRAREARLAAVFGK